MALLDKGGPDAHALVTGPISGRIPISHEAHPDGWVNVTPDVLYTDSEEHVKAIADAIEAEHYARGTHPSLETGAV